MKIKAVVKVMNFHSLLRVDSSRKKAERYGVIEDELEQMMLIIANNRNLKLDKLVTDPDPTLPVLRFYIGSDYGFCGNVNSSVTSFMKNAEGGESIVIGKKLRPVDKEAVHLKAEEFQDRFEEIRSYLERAVLKKEWSAVEIAYNHYYNSGTIRPEVRRIFPLELKKDIKDISQRNLIADYMIEGDAFDILSRMMIAYLTYEVKIAVASAYASENIMRQNSTSESLKKIEEIEDEEIKTERKQRNEQSFRKTVDSYIKQKSLQGA